MEKKIWSNPELKGMDVIKTHSEECSCGIVSEPNAFKVDGSTTNGQGGGNGGGNNTQNHHFCHGKNSNNPQHSSEDNGIHFASIGCTQTHILNGEVVGCCCYKAGTSGH